MKKYCLDSISDVKNERTFNHAITNNFYSSFYESFLVQFLTLLIRGKSTPLKWGLARFFFLSLYHGRYFAFVNSFAIIYIMRVVMSLSMALR